VATDIWIHRIAGALPDDGLPFKDIRLLMERMHWPEQHWWKWCHESDFRKMLREAIKAKLVRFLNGKYIRAKKLHILPMPPLKLPHDEIETQWPEQAKGRW
jgi:hypothetical protein